MIAIDCSQFRESLKSYLDLVFNNYDPLMITCRENRHVVVASEEMYNNLIESIHVVTLNVRVENERARKEYTDCGFRIGIIKHENLAVSFKLPGI